MPANILLIILDSVRARNTSLGESTTDTTPFCAEFAERATTYTHARSPGAKSLTSHASIFTGLDVEQHNITSAEDKLGPGHSVFDQLQTEGYDTGVFSENTWLTDVDVGLKTGFDTVEGPRNLPFPDAVDPKAFVAEAGRGQYAEYLRASLNSSRPIQSLFNGVATKLAWDYPRLLPDSLQTTTAGEIYADLFLEWEHDREQNTPWAACINFMDAHIPYEPRAEFDHWGGPEARAIQDDLEDLEWTFLGGQEPWWKRQALESLYDGAIAQIDAQIRRIIETLRKRQVLDETLVVVTSDHGEGFGEPDEIRDLRVAEHGVSVHEAITHVPLLVKYPGQTTPVTVEEPATLARFPEAARAAVAGGGKPGKFVPDGPVRITAVGLDEALERRAGEYVDNLEPFTSTTRAMVEKRGEQITKEILWRDRAERVIIRDAQTSYRTDSNDDSIRSRVDSAFAGISDAGVRTTGRGIEGADTATTERLEDLGYI